MNKKVIFLIVFVVVVASVIFLGIFGGEISSLRNEVYSDSVSVTKVEIVKNNVATERTIRTDESEGVRYSTIPEGTVTIRAYWTVLPENTTNKNVVITSSNPDVTITYKLDNEGNQLYCEIAFIRGATESTYLEVACKDRPTHKEKFEIRVIPDGTVIPG